MDYGDIDKLQDFYYEKIKGSDVPAEVLKSLKEVIDYADDCYVEHCENIGYIAIAEIEEMEKRVADKAWEWIKRTCHKSPIQYTELEILYQSFKNYIENETEDTTI